MRLAKRSHGSRMEMNMTPMIDVTFLLLIFFMTANQVSNVNRERIPLPPLPGAKDQSEESLTINIDLAGQIIVSGTRHTPASLATLLADEKQKADQLPGRKLVVAVRAHRDGTCRTVNEVIGLLDRLQIPGVNLGVEKPT
jgi:biopolymer transport protein ExbD